MKTVQLRVLKDFTDGDLKFKEGQIINVPENHTVYIKMGVAEIFSAIQPETEIDRIMREKGCDRETAHSLLKDRKERQETKEGWKQQEENKFILIDATKKIPHQLRNARFIKIDMTDPKNRKWKKPLESKWQTVNNYKWDDIELLTSIGEGNNYGVALGFDDIIVIDADHILVDQAVREKLPDTFRVKTGGYYYGKEEYGRKIHFYYRCPELKTTIVLDEDAGGNHYGEIRSQGAQVIAPGSKHYDTGNTYEVENDGPIATITLEQLNEVMSPFMTEHILKDKVNKENDNQEKKCDLDITKVINPDDYTAGLQTEKENGIYRGKHPVHESNTNRNFIFDINKGLWYCNRHNTGGGAIELIGVKEKLIDCKNVKPGAITGELFKQIIKIAKEKYGLELPLKRAGVTDHDTRNVPIPDLPKILKKEDFYVEDEKGTPRFKAPLMAKAICFNENGENRGIRVTDDNKKIMWFNSKYWRDNGEELIRDMVQKILGDSSCLKHKNEVISCIKDCMELQIEREQLDADKYKIGLQNGVFDLQTQQLLPFDKQYFITSLFPINYNVLAKCEKFKQFLPEILEAKDILVIQEMFGYCFLKDYPLAVIFFLVGIGRNGKSTLLNVLIRMLGKCNVSNVPMQSLCDDNFSKIDLYRKHANIISDLSAKELEHTGPLKQLSGEDQIRGRNLYEKAMNFFNFAKLISAMNEIPVCHDNTLAWMQRCACIEFPNQFLDGAEGTDPHIIDKMTTQEEIDGIFLWCMDGLKRLFEKKSFSPHNNLNDMEKFIAQTKNSILQFVREHIRNKPGNEILKDDVYKSFLQYCLKKKFTTVASNHFSTKFKQYLMEQNITFGEGISKILNGRIWKDIEIIDIPTEEKPKTKNEKLVIASGIDQFENMSYTEIQKEVDNE
jgi:P4 family phage/plasmid primase-like protien